MADSTTPTTAWPRNQPSRPALEPEPQVEIKVRDRGPYKVTGPIRLVDADGREHRLEGDQPIALCRCGQSRTKPFCDASHKDAGFDDCWRASVSP